MKMRNERALATKGPGHRQRRSGRWMVVLLALVIPSGVLSAQQPEALPVPGDTAAVVETWRGMLALPAVSLLTGRPIALLAGAPATTPKGPLGQGPCSDLAEVVPPSTVITAAQELPADAARGWPPRCLASGAIDGRIRFELHLPVADAWNGKFLMGGGGGFGGVVANQALSPQLPGGDALQRGYATIGTDTGHRGRGPSPTLDASWAVDDWTALVDFGYRAVHETAMLGRALTTTYYDRAPSHSYFYGCSNGGRQGMMAAQRHPHLFDGIVAGAPGLAFPNMILHYVRVAHAMFSEGDPERPVLSAGRLQALGDAVMRACDGADGLQDGIVSDPLGCRFDPPAHLTEFSEAELQAVEAVYEALYVGERRIHPGYPPGHEATPGAWDLRITGHGRPGGPLNYAATDQFVGSILMNDATLDLRDAPSLKELLKRSDMVARVLNATSPDLRTFGELGGRIIMFHGWADHGVSPYISTDYHRSVVELFQHRELVDEFLRLFMLPGALHCSGGDGTDRVDWLTALERWVEKGHAPDQLIAVKEGEDGDELLVRPICPHPQRSHHIDGGDPSRPEGFVCREP